MTALTLLLVALAAARCWRLLAVDDIGDPIRVGMSRATERLPDRLRTSLQVGWFCPFCLGYWISLGWVGSALAWGDHWAWQLAAGSLAVSYVVGHVGARLDRE
jgi:hypothetical protein